MDKKSGVLLVLLTAVISGFSIFLNKFGVSGINSGIFAFSKNIVVSIFLISTIFLFNQFNELKNLKRRGWLNLILIGLIGGAIPFLLFFRGLQLTSSASASFIHKSMFLFVILFAFLFLKEKIKKNVAVAAILLMIGIFLLIKFSLNQNFLSAGNLLILIATVFWAGENVLSKYALKELQSNIVAFGRMFFGSLFILIYLIATSQFNLIFALNLNQMSWILFSSIFLYLYVFTWYNGLKFVKVSVATAILLLGSVITAFLDYLFSGMVLTLSQSIGILFILVGILFLIGVSQSVALIRDLKWKITS